MSKQSGGRILLESLRAHGVKKIFCVPGESYLDALDALHDANDIRTVTCRQEGGAAFMAEAYGKLTGHPGICFVTRGPGACNASIGVHTAMQDSTPFILLVGQVARDQKGREAFQEVEYRDMFKPPFTKWVTEIEHAADIPHVIKEAFEIATTGRPGPVVIALPEDMLCEDTEAPVQKAEVPPHFAPLQKDMDALRDLLATAEKPLVIVGGSQWTDSSIKAFENFADRAKLPVATSFRRQDAFCNSHPSYVGALGTTVDPKLCDAVRDADVIIAVGTRLGEIMTQGYTLLEPGTPKQKLVHVYPDASELNKVYKATLAIHAATPEFVKALQDMPVSAERWAARTATLNGYYQAFSTVRSRDKFEPDMDGIIEDIINALPQDAIITTDAGNFSGWPQRYIRYDRPMRLLAPTSGAMGYSVPAAVAASLTQPQRVVVAFMGDGGFMMTAQELATVCHEGGKPIFLVFNNGMYGTIRMHQEKHYPGRVSATHLTNPDFAAYAKSFGIAGHVVTKTADFAAVFQAAMESEKPALIEIRMDPQQITTAKKLSEL
jgi:acetolactate synthase I/II/III large subunit